MVNETLVPEEFANEVSFTKEALRARVCAMP